MIARKHEFGMMVLLDETQGDLSTLTEKGEMIAELRDFGGTNPQGKIYVEAVNFSSGVNFRPVSDGIRIFIDPDKRYVLSEGRTIRMPYTEGQCISVHYTEEKFDSSSQ